METNTMTPPRQFNIRPYVDLFADPDPPPHHISNTTSAILTRKRWIRICNHMLRTQHKATFEAPSDFSLFKMGDDLLPLRALYKEILFWIWRHLVWELLTSTPRKLVVEETICPALHGQNAFLILRTDLNTGKMKILETRPDGSKRKPTEVDGFEFIPQLFALLGSDSIPIRNKSGWEEPDFTLPDLPKLKPEPGPEEKRQYKTNLKKIRELLVTPLPSSQQNKSS